MKIENKGYYFVEMNVLYFKLQHQPSLYLPRKKNFSYRERLRVLAFFISFMCTAGAKSQVAKTKRFLVWTYNIGIKQIVDFLDSYIYVWCDIHIHYVILLY